jgi:hypothetical protein
MMPRPQFSIRTLLLLTLVVAIGCLGLILERWRRIHEQEARETEFMLQRIQGEPGSTTMPRAFNDEPLKGLPREDSDSSRSAVSDEASDSD